MKIILRKKADNECDIKNTNSNRALIETPIIRILIASSSLKTCYALYQIERGILVARYRKALKISCEQYVDFFFLGQTYQLFAKKLKSYWPHSPLKLRYAIRCSEHTSYFLGFLHPLASSLYQVFLRHTFPGCLNYSYSRYFINNDDK